MKMNMQIPKNSCLFLVLFCFGIAGNLSAQGVQLPMSSPAYHILDRLEIKTGLPTPYHSSLKYYQRGAAVKYALALDTLEGQTPLSALDRADLQYIFRDNNEWLGQNPLPKTLGGRHPEPGSQIDRSLADPRYETNDRKWLPWVYPTPANLFEVNTPDFHLRVNPLLNIKTGPIKDQEQQFFLNQRGIELRGGVDDRIFIYFNILENQAQFPDYVRNYFQTNKTLPGAGLTKNYSDNLFGVQNGYDFLLSQGYLAFNASPHVGLQFGFGRNAIGNGYRSLLLSDFSNNYLYLKINWEVWKFHYQNIFAELSASSANFEPGNAIVPKKYMAAHHLSFNIRPNLNVGLFEAVIFSRENQFELQYLNPVIFYRSIEHSLGSPDNVLIGMDAKWNFLQRFQLYGQFLFDEFLFKELFIERRGWWGNKFSYQAGLKYIDAFGIDHLDLQAEYNTARPFTYTHFDSTSAYTHYRQPLAHPLGANFREVVLLGRYQPFHRLIIEGRLLRATTGEDDGQGSNWGTNLLVSSNSRSLDYGNDIGQGVATTITITGLDISYMLTHNVYLDLQYFRRQKDSALADRQGTDFYMLGGIRVNLGQWRQDF
ncbi:MAG: hypothetical protein H6555_02335 [Lewinellaceae bacterium]|nr:hypothetical protein [Lewinellaceae bacterium]